MGLLRSNTGSVIKEITNEYRWLIYHRERVTNATVIRVEQHVAETHNIDATIIATLENGDNLTWDYGDFYLARHVVEKFARSVTIIDRRDSDIFADLWINLTTAKQQAVDSAARGGHTIVQWMGDDPTTPNDILWAQCRDCKRTWRLNAHTPYGQRTRYNMTVSGGTRICGTKSTTTWKYTGNE